MTEESMELPPRVGDVCVVTSLRKILQEDTEYFEQSTHPCNSDPRNIAGRIKGGYKMKIKTGTNRIVLLRFLLAKLVHSKEGLFIEEYLCMFELYYELSEMRDPLFQNKYFDILERVCLVLQGMSEVKTFPVVFSERAKNLLCRVLGEFVPQPREYFGLAGQRDLRQSFRIQLEDSLIIKPPAAKRFIGVGYKDKGTRRDPAFDGSLRWQEVATIFANKEREAEELDSSSKESLNGME